MQSRNSANDSILIVANSEYDKDSIIKALRKENLKPIFADNQQSIYEIIENQMPAAMLHIWPGSGSVDAIKLHQQLSISNPSLCRIIQVEAVSPQIAALAADTSIKRVLTQVLKPTSIATEIQMALSSMQQQPELIRLMHQMRNNGSYDQVKIDAEIERSYLFYPHDPTVRLEFANLSFRQKRVALAQEIAESLLAQNQNNVRIINLLGRIYMFKGEHQQAIEMLEAANVLSPFNTDRLLLLGDAFYNIGNTAKAKDYYLQAIDANPNVAHQAHAGLVKANLSEGDLNSALEIVQGSLSEEEAASLFNNAAVHAVHKGQIESSLQLYGAALKILQSPKLSAAVHFNMSLAYEKLGRIKDALFSIKKSIELDPSFEKTKRHKARLDSKFHKLTKKAS